MKKALIERGYAVEGQCHVLKVKTSGGCHLGQVNTQKKTYQMHFLVDLVKGLKKPDRPQRNFIAMANNFSDFCKEHGMRSGK